MGLKDKKIKDNLRMKKFFCRCPKASMRKTGNTVIGDPLGPLPPSLGKESYVLENIEVAVGGSKKNSGEV